MNNRIWQEMDKTIMMQEAMTLRVMFECLIQPYNDLFAFDFLQTFSIDIIPKIKLFQISN